MKGHDAPITACEECHERFTMGDWTDSARGELDAESYGAQLIAFHILHHDMHDWDRQGREGALRRFVQKFHRQTDCGRDGTHWSECEAVTDQYEPVLWEAKDGSVR